MSKELTVIIPVYNEEETILQVLESWTRELKRLRIEAEIHVYDDGSKDRSLAIINGYAVSESRVVAHSKSNTGHGPTILRGYADHTGTPWVFQIDSDNEMGPEGFANLWNRRDQFDFLIGCRLGKRASLARRFVTFISRLSVLLFYGFGATDVNIPYRLMRTEKFRALFKIIPADTFAPNVLVTGYACKKKLRIFEAPVPYRRRASGGIAMQNLGLAKVAIKSFWQTLRFRMVL